MISTEVTNITKKQRVNGENIINTIHQRLFTFSTPLTNKLVQMYFMSKTLSFYSEGATSALLLLGWFASELVFVLSMVCFLTQRKGIESHFQQYIAKRRQLWGSKDLLDWDRVGINDELKTNSDC